MREEADSPGEHRSGGHRPTDHPFEALRAVRGELDRLEELLTRDPRSAASEVAHSQLPAWLRVTKGEHRLPVTATVTVAIALQLLLPHDLIFRPTWLLPALEIALFAVLVVANPVRINREHRLLRVTGLVLIGVISLANTWSVVVMVSELLRAKLGEDPGPLLATGGAIWLTNVIAFALWYWELDRGGPAARAQARHKLPDFQFVQMDDPHLARPDWEPYFLDYLYLSFTNATAFSPTDVMPLTRWAKLLMLIQACVSLATVTVVISRAVGLFK